VECSAGKYCKKVYACIKGTLIYKGRICGVSKLFVIRTLKHTIVLDLLCLLTLLLVCL
jgi:hypothetical protein